MASAPPALSSNISIRSLLARIFATSIVRVIITLCLFVPLAHDYTLVIVRPARTPVIANSCGCASSVGPRGRPPAPRHLSVKCGTQLTWVHGEAQSGSAGVGRASRQPGW